MSVFLPLFVFFVRCDGTFFWGAVSLRFLVDFFPFEDLRLLFVVRLLCSTDDEIVRLLCSTDDERTLEEYLCI